MHGPTTDSIQRIDPSTNKLVATIAIPVDDTLVAVGGGSVWVAKGDENRLFRIDPERNAVAQTIQTMSPRGLALELDPFGAAASSSACCRA